MIGHCVVCVYVCVSFQGTLGRRRADNDRQTDASLFDGDGGVSSSRRRRRKEPGPLQRIIHRPGGEEREREGFHRFIEDLSELEERRSRLGTRTISSPSVKIIEKRREKNVERREKKKLSLPGSAAGREDPAWCVCVCVCAMLKPCFFPQRNKVGTPVIGPMR